MALVRDNVNFFTENGLETGLWFQGFGFGDPLSYEKCSWTRLRSVMGKDSPQDALCPEDPGFTEAYLSWIRDLMSTGARILMLDDDLCMSVRPGIGCFCDRHLALLSQELGEPVALDSFREKAFTGGKNRYRDAWYKVMGDSMRRFCRKVRETVDSIDKTVRVGFCAGYTSWDIEGVDAVELTKILAGDTKPFFRFTGAPYWVAPGQNRFHRQQLGSVIECARNQNAWVQDEDVEYFSEADSYPRPRSHVNASLIEDFDLAMQAEGVHSLKYMVDYVSSPSYETGYAMIHCRNMPFYGHIRQVFGNKKSCGVRLFRPAHLICDANLPETFAGEQGIMRSYFSLAAAMLAGVGIPTCYSGESANAAFFGDDAHHMPADVAFTNVLLDIPAAKILQSKGIDVGLESATPRKMPVYEFFGQERVYQRYLESGRLYDNIPGFYQLQVNPSAQVQSRLDESGDIASYVYQNGATRYLVLAMDANGVGESSSFYCSYARQAQLLEFFGHSYPAIAKEPEMYACCAENENSMGTLFLNLSRDLVFDFYIDLPWPCDTFKLYGAEGQLTEDKKRIHVTTDFAPSAPLLLEIPKYTL